MSIQQIGDASFSPDGSAVAHVERRPRFAARKYEQPSLGGNDRADIWLTPTGGASPKNITNGEIDRSGFWWPLWSPDGAYIAMLSTRGGDNICIWLWEKSTGKLRRLSERGVAYSWMDSPFAWIDSRHLATTLVPLGQQAHQLSIDTRTMAEAMTAWPKATGGREVTASTVESGIRVDLAARPQDELAIISVTGELQNITPAASFRQLRVAPDKEHFAFLKQIALSPPEAMKPLEIADRLGFGGFRYQIGIANARGQLVVASLSGVRSVVPDSFQWSRDGRSFALLGIAEHGDQGAVRVFRGSVGESGSVDELSLRDLDPLGLVWAADDRLLVSAGHNGRVDWYLVSHNTLKNVTQTLKAAPRVPLPGNYTRRVSSDILLPDPTGRMFIGIADGRVWRFNINSEQWADVTADLKSKLSDVVWPRFASYYGYPGDRLVETIPSGFASIVLSSSSTVDEFYSMDIAEGRATPIIPPSRHAELIAYSSAAGAALFTAAERDGTVLTVLQGVKRRPIVEMNQFLAQITEGERRLIQYKSLDGKELYGWILLPTRCSQDRRCPLVVWVYPSSVQGRRVPRLTQLNLDDSLNLQLLAARGYAVLVPSMPLKAYGETMDPYMELSKGVLPAIEKAIELGIADPKRVALMGHSFGGYATYGILCQTNRFQAAIAIAGMSDFVSQYGTFQAQSRYAPYPHEDLYFPTYFETAWGHMGNPPWQDWSRYVRNSPVFYVDRVETPLMIVQGDLDYVAMQQGEEMFTALYRQGKRTRFVRYWGEGHILNSPANIRDFWYQTYAWLDEFCDISRDAKGNLIFDGEHVKSRNGSPPLKPEDFARFNEMELKRHPWVTRN